MPGSHFKRRIATTIAAATVAALTFTGCATSSDSGQSNTKVSLRFNWWGSQSRQNLTQQAIDAFEKQHPNIQVTSEFTDFNSYFDKLSTSAAAGDLADIVTLTDPYMYSYAENNQIVDLKQYSDVLPLDSFSQSSLSNMAIDGKQLAAPTGQGAFAIAINPSLFEKAGIPLPDDNSWTWEDYTKTATSISSKLPGVAGSGLFLLEQGMDVWLRQHGQDYWQNGGAKIGFDAKTAASWWQYLLELSKSGGTPTIGQEVERSSLAPEQTPLAQGKEAMSVIAVGQLGTYEKSGQNLKLVKFPGEAEFSRPGAWTNPGAWYSIPTTSKHPKEAAEFINFMVNTADAGNIQKFDRGVPANSKVLEAITPGLAPVDKEVASYVTAVQNMKAAPFARQNAKGGPVMSDSVKRLTQEVLFGRMSPDNAAKQLISDAQAGM